MLEESPQLARDASVELALAAADVRDINVVENCPDLRAWLDSEGIIHDDRSLEAITRLEDWPVAMISISLPALADNGATALLYSYEGYGPLAGGLSSMIYKRDAQGGWVLHRTDHLTIS
ncbi:hypothetical protein [Alteraurantiacibacter buctensis]|uniref:DUF4440 domain-containing protein n=1 Tax=Alteraurantiacibacter buctensis TaxID=1503981 RepID=A0A844YWV1_9SPHN|nr:hypothetical protein [Alteraurantiacibacter buctensis]MXO72815.1 hypothetical protein [Alteraurantiacibacter buctensis]